MHKYTLLVFPLILMGCPPSSKMPHVGDADAANPLVAADGAAPVDACAAAEDMLLRLKCTDARGRLIGGPNLHGEPWSQICRDDLAQGVDLGAACMITKSDCAGVNSCAQ